MVYFKIYQLKLVHNYIYPAESWATQAVSSDRFSEEVVLHVIVSYAANIKVQSLL